MEQDTRLGILRQDVSGPFAPERFAMRRLPAHVGHVSIPFGSGLPSCLDMLVKLPGGDLVVPEPYRSNEAIRHFLETSFAHEDGILPGWRESHYAYLTVDQRVVLEGASHRNGGWHFDGMQGERYKTKLNACHQYVVSDKLMTEFTDHPTDATGLDELKHNWFVELGRQVPEDAPVFTPDAYEIMLMSAYQLHRSPVARLGQGGLRTFIRLDISLKQQDRLGNTPNPDLPAPFEFVPRSLPAGLALPISDSGWSGGTKFGPC